MSFLLLFLVSKIELIERQTQLSSILLVSILLFGAMISLVKINYANFFGSIATGFFKFKAQEKFLNESHRMGQGFSIALYLNFVYSVSLCFFLLFFDGDNFRLAFMACIVFSFCLLLIQHAGFRLLSVISGESKIIENGVAINRQVSFFSGILFLILSLFWILNFRYRIFFMIVFFLILGLTLVFRLAKGLLFAFQFRYSWYYIFLYLCTLEVLPVFILNKLIQTYLQAKQ
jgi:hypothetical protein